MIRKSVPWTLIAYLPNIVCEVLEVICVSQHVFIIYGTVIIQYCW